MEYDDIKLFDDIDSKINRFEFTKYLSIFQKKQVLIFYEILKQLSIIYESALNFNNQKVLCIIVNESKDKHISKSFTYLTNWSLLSISPNFNDDFNNTLNSKMNTIKSEIKNNHEIILIFPYSYLKELNSIVNLLKNKSIWILYIPNNKIIQKLAIEHCNLRIIDLNKMPLIIYSNNYNVSNFFKILTN